nr:hypothetical protein [Tanacetum cinerariifolium]
LADASRKDVQTYTRRRRAVSTGSGGISTASRLFSIAEESVSTIGASMPVSTAGMVQEVNIKRVEADEKLTQRLQAEERNKYNEVDQAKMLVDLINQRKRYVSAQGEAHNQEDQPKDLLGVLGATKVLADASRKDVQTYTRRRRAVSTGSGGISTASRLFSIAEESVSTIGASMPVSTAGMVQE